MGKFKKMMEVSSNVGNYSNADEGEPDTGFIRGNKKRKLGTLAGKPEPWFERGGYIQTQFPKADFIYGKGEEEDFEYFLQIESYGRRIYAQEQLTSILTFDLEAYVEKTFSSSQPDKPLFRVMSGPYKTKSEVNNAREILIKNDRQPFILKKCTKT